MKDQPGGHGPYFWAILGLGTAIIIQVAQANSLGGLSGLIAVGKTSALLPVIQQELPHLVVTDGEGHDGQVTYALGLDPWATWGPGVVPEAPYRYRRILMSVVASGFGTIDGQPLLWLLTLLNAIGFACTAVFAAAIAKVRSMPRWAALAATLNIGLWLSLQITSPDALAFALGLAGVAAHLRRRDLLAVICLSLAALAKETYLLIPLSLMIHAWFVQRDNRRAVLLSAGLVPPVLWSAFLALRIGDPLGTGGNLTWPFVGIVDAAGFWGGNPSREMFLLGITAVIIFSSVLLIIKSPQSIWAWLALPWLLLGAISSHWIWDLGNNAVRAFLPLMTFAAFGFMDKSGRVAAT